LRYALAVHERIDAFFCDKERVLLNELNINVVAQKSGHGHLSNALQLIFRESQIVVARFVVEPIAELPITELLGDNAFLNEKIIMLENLPANVIICKLKITSGSGPDQSTLHRKLAKQTNKQVNVIRTSVQSFPLLDHILRHVVKVLELVCTIQTALLPVQVVAGQTVITASLNVESGQRPSFRVSVEDAFEQSVLKVLVHLRIGTVGPVDQGASDYLVHGVAVVLVVEQILGDRYGI
jgi:hypothetical protein